MRVTFCCAKLIESFCDYNDFFEMQMKELLEHVEKTWKMIPDGPEKEILRSHAEQSRIYTIQYADK